MARLQNAVDLFLPLASPEWEFHRFKQTPAASAFICSVLESVKSA
jgi:hypothetical protein